MKNKPQILDRLYYKCNRIGENVNIHDQMDTYKILYNEESEVREQIYYYIADCTGLSNEEQLTAEGYNILVENGYIIKTEDDQKITEEVITIEPIQQPTESTNRIIYDQEQFNKENNNKSVYELKQYILEGVNGTIITGGSFKDLETAIEKLKQTDYIGTFYLKRYYSSFNMKIILQ